MILTLEGFIALLSFGLACYKLGYDRARRDNQKRRNDRSDSN